MDLMVQVDGLTSKDLLKSGGSYDRNLVDDAGDWAKVLVEPAVVSAEATSSSRQQLQHAAAGGRGGRVRSGTP